MAIVVVLVVAALIIWFVVKSSSNWKTVLTGSGDSAAEVRAKHAYLKEQKVKCRIRTVATSGFQAGNAHESVKLEVHNKHLDQANSLLEQFVE